MSQTIPESDLFHVIDASKMQDYMLCPRKYFFTHVLGWRPSQPNVHLEFGTAWHLAQEVLLEKGYNVDACTEAFQKFFEHYNQHFAGPEWEEINSPKIPANVLRALPQYCKKYRSDLDEFDVLHIEVAGSVQIAPEKVMYFKTDTICHGPQGYFSLEHKTGRYFGTNWAAGWRQKMQAGVYNHVLYGLYDPDDVYGVIINGAFFTSAPRVKKNGEVYASDRDNEFHRVPVRKNLSQMEEWLVSANFWHDRIIEDHERLTEAEEDDAVLLAFRKNEESCTQYGVCSFLDYCSVWSNPLQHVDEMPTGFHREIWDPRKQPLAREQMDI